MPVLALPTKPLLQQRDLRGNYSREKDEERHSYQVTWGQQPEDTWTCDEGGAVIQTLGSKNRVKKLKEKMCPGRSMESGDSEVSRPECRAL